MNLNDLSQELYRRLLDNEDPLPNLSASAAAASALATKRKLVLALRGQGRLREAASVAIGCCTKCGQVLHIDSFKYKDVQRIIIIVTRILQCCHQAEELCRDLGGKAADLSLLATILEETRRDGLC